MDYLEKLIEDEDLLKEKLMIYLILGNSDIHKAI